MANGEFYVAPAQYGQSIRGFGDFIERRGAAADQAEYEQQAKQAVAAALQSGDPRMMQQVSVQFPEVAQTMREAYGFTNDITEQVAKEGYRQFLTSDPADTKRRAAILAGTAETIQQAGGRPTITSQDVESYLQDPEGTAKSIELAFAGIAPTEYEALRGGQSAEVAPSNVREYQYYQSLTPEQQEQYINMKRASQTFRQGDVQMVQRPTQPGVAAPITEAGAAPVTQAQAQQVATEQQATKAASEEAATQAIKKSGEAFDKLSTARAAIPLYDRAIELVQQGAGTGAIESRLPSLKQSSVALDDIQRQLGLNVLQNTTFGALSEGELRLALQAGLPTSLEGDELISELQRRKAAQEKLSGYLEEAATFLGTPGNTVADWTALQKQRTQARQGSDIDSLINKYAPEQ